MTTPAERITAYLDARRRFPVYADQMAECKIGGQDWTYLTETDLRAVLADNERLTAQVADRKRRYEQLGKNDRMLTRQVVDKSDEIATLQQRFDDFAETCAGHCADRCVEQVAAEDEIARLTADLQRAEAEVAKWVKADSADIAAGSYAGEVERLTGELADTRAKLAAASRAVAATDGRDRATYWRGWDDCVTAVKGQLGRRPEPAQPPAVAAPDAATRATVTGPDVARDGAERGQEGPEGSKAPSGTTQAATEAPTPSGESDPTGGDR